MADYTETQDPFTGKENKQPTGQNLAIAALITAIVTFVMAVIPCVGVIAIIPGIVAIILASVGLSQTAGKSSPRGILIAGLIIAIVASMISFSQIFVVGNFARKAESKWPGNVKNIIRDVQEDVFKDLEDANISIKIENDSDVVEIKASTERKDRIKELEELEKQGAGTGDTLQTRE